MSSCATGNRSRSPASSTTSSRTTRSAIPILSKLPIIGALFKSKAERNEETELMVLITPRLVRPLNPDEVPALPTNIQAPDQEAATSVSSSTAPPASPTRRLARRTRRFQ